MGGWGLAGVCGAEVVDGTITVGGAVFSSRPPNVAAWL